MAKKIVTVENIGSISTSSFLKDIIPSQIASQEPTYIFTFIILRSHDQRHFQPKMCFELIVHGYCPVSTHFRSVRTNVAFTTYTTIADASHPYDDHRCQPNLGGEQNSYLKFGSTQYLFHLQ